MHWNRGFRYHWLSRFASLRSCVSYSMPSRMVFVSELRTELNHIYVVRQFLWIFYDFIRFSSAQHRPHSCPICRHNPTRLIFLAIEQNDAVDELKCIKCYNALQEENTERTTVMVLDCGHILHESCLNSIPHGPFAQEYVLRKCPLCNEYSAGVTIWFQ